MAVQSPGPVKRGMRDYTLNLDGVNEQSVDVDGDFFHVQSVSVGGVNVFLRFDDGPAVIRQQGQGNRVYYSRVTLTASAAAQVVVQLGYGYATDSRASVNATITTPITPALHNPPIADVAVGAASAAVLSAADPNKLGILVGVSSTQPNGVRVADGTVGAAAGILVEPGQTLPIFSQDAQSAFNPGGAPVTVTITKFMKT